jgi:hypothetical protein
VCPATVCKPAAELQGSPHCQSPDGAGVLIACRAGRIAFWVLIALAVLLALHGALVLGFRLRRRHLPAILEFPRLELFLLLFLIAPIGQIAARESTC